MGDSSYFRFDDDNKTKYIYIISIITREMGKLKTYSPTYRLDIGSHDHNIGLKL